MRAELAVAAFDAPRRNARDELAEFSASFLCAHSGITNTLDNSAAYIDSWRKVLKTYGGSAHTC